jgi:hypothetical protein
MAMAALEKAWHIFPPGGNIGLFPVLRVPLSLRSQKGIRISGRYQARRVDRKRWCLDQIDHALADE